nr:radical SAM protein [Adlercreutzia sp. ZJ473]
MLRRYQAFYDGLEEDYLGQVAAMGLSFEEAETQPRALRSCAEGAWRCRNNGASLTRGWLSPACERCRTGERMMSSFISLRCSKSCYFCFNKAQEGYEHFLAHRRDVAAELEQLSASGEALDFFAVTGGEPCLFPRELVEAVATARRLFPACHVRLYTSGASMDSALVDELCAAGLDEVRFSVKLEDGPDEYARVLDLVRYAVPRLDVLVEMPVIPGSLDEMRRLLRDLDAAGARGVNLLEFCYPLNNAAAYARRGFSLRRPPFELLYDYWYAGGFPVAGSEAEALKLMRFAAKEGLGLGVHYCSFDNKNSGQIFAQNQPLRQDPALRAEFPLHAFDEGDFFAKSAKVFAADAGEVCQRARELGIPFEEGALEDELGAVGYVEVPLADAAALMAALPQAAAAVSFCVLEQRDGAWVLREIAVRPLEHGR